jgi:hypothetical protein
MNTKSQWGGNKKTRGSQKTLLFFVQTDFPSEKKTTQFATIVLGYNKLSFIFVLLLITNTNTL